MLILCVDDCMFACTVVYSPNLKKCGGQNPPDPPNISHLILAPPEMTPHGKPLFRYPPTDSTADAVDSEIAQC